MFYTYDDVDKKQRRLVFNEKRQKNVNIINKKT